LGTPQASGRQEVPRDDVVDVGAFRRLLKLLGTEVDARIRETRQKKEE
jgi:hypothetical protein